MMNPGTLYLVATPIGNLEDITLRAIRTLKEVDFIACEDTRQTQKLLRHLEIQKPLTSYHDHNERTKSSYLIEQLINGQNMALVSDAGTPGISDPGFRIVREAIQRGVKVVPIPGVSAAITALMASGLPTDEFHFVGFLPMKPGKKKKMLESLKEVVGTLVIYESPYRAKKTLGLLYEILGDREVVIARELTKVYEEFIRVKLSEVSQQKIMEKGEFVLLIKGRAYDDRKSSESDIFESASGEKEDSRMD